MSPPDSPHRRWIPREELNALWEQDGEIQPGLKVRDFQHVCEDLGWDIRVAGEGILQWLLVGQSDGIDLLMGPGPEEAETLRGLIAAVEAPR